MAARLSVCVAVWPCLYLISALPYPTVSPLCAVSRRRRPPRVLWGEAQAVHKLSSSQLIASVAVHDLLASVGARRERHLHHYNFEPLPFVLLVTTARVLLLEVTPLDSGAAVSLATLPAYKLSWQRGLKAQELESPSEKFKRMKRQIGDAVSRYSAAAAIQASIAAHDGGSGVSLKDKFAVLEAKTRACLHTLAALPLEHSVRNTAIAMHLCCPSSQCSPPRACCACCRLLGCHGM